MSTIGDRAARKAAEIKDTGTLQEDVFDLQDLVRNLRDDLERETRRLEIFGEVLSERLYGK